MCDEYLTGPALHRAIADAQENGEGPGVFEVSIDDVWRKPSSWGTLVFNDGLNIRRKPRMRHLTTQDGQRYEWPEPIKRVPKAGEVYYTPSFDNDERYCTKHFWANSSIDYERLEKGVCQTTTDGAKQHARALIAASGGSCE